MYNEGSKHEIDDDVNCVMMASENDQLFLGHAQIVKPLMNSEKFYFSKEVIQIILMECAIKIFIKYKMPLN